MHYEERAYGAAIIAVLIGIVGFFVVLGGVLGVVVSLFHLDWGTLSTKTLLSWLSGDALLVSLIAVVIGLIYLAVAVGLYRQHLWALVVMFVFGILYVVGEVSGVIYSLYYASPRLTLTDTGVIGSLLAIVVVVIVLGYLAAVRDDFI